jgi:hypothetical protein
MSGGCEVTSYLRQIIHTFCNKINMSNSVITQEQKQEPLVDDNSQANVLYYTACSGYQYSLIIKIVANNLYS